MIKKINDIGKLIGVITQIIDDKNLFFIVNNEVECKIGDILCVETKENSFVLAKIFEIKVDFYLENAKQFFVSKAVENNIQKLTEPNGKPRYGNYVTANILGHYRLVLPDLSFTEIKTSVNRYTPYIFQKVYSVSFDKTLELYGLVQENFVSYDSSDGKKISLGQLSFPILDDLRKKEISLHFNTEIFRRHTLITGVTGSGKSRLAALIAKELATIGAHVSILDPHDEYTDLLADSKDYEIYKIGVNEEINLKNYKNVKFRIISFEEKSINANTLTKLLPTLSEQQENTIYEMFSYVDSNIFNLSKFINLLIDELNLELEKDYYKSLEAIKKIQFESEKATRNHVEFIERFISGLRKITEYGRANKTNVLIAIISKVNELRKNQLITNSEPNWLKNSPRSIDVFNIDYSTNDYIRRFINSIIQYFLRKRNEDKMRVLIIDEAHMLLAEDSPTSKLVKQLLREARKFNITVMFISQNIIDIPLEIRNQFQNHFMFRDSYNETTKYLPDQVCYSSLFGSKALFAMKVRDMNEINFFSSFVNQSTTEVITSKTGS